VLCNKDVRDFAQMPRFCRTVTRVLAAASLLLLLLLAPLQPLLVLQHGY
jgi:hypothetical protein